jgi:hypothetical protein
MFDSIDLAQPVWRNVARNVQSLSEKVCPRSGHGRKIGLMPLMRRAGQAIRSIVRDGNNANRMSIMQARELLQRIESNRAPLVIDARGEIELKRGHIKGAILEGWRKAGLPLEGKAPMYASPGARKAATNHEIRK